MLIFLVVVGSTNEDTNQLFSGMDFLGYFQDLLLSIMNMFLLYVSCSFLKFCPLNGEPKQQQSLFFPKSGVCLKAHIKNFACQKKIYCIQANTKLATHQVKTKGH